MAGITIAAKLAAYTAARAAPPFNWPRNNCCHLAAKWVQQMTGLDPMRGLPETAGALQARRLVHRLGGLQAAWTTALSRQPIAPALAQTGDLMLVDLLAAEHQRGIGQAVGICSGRHVLVLDVNGKVQQLDHEMAVCAWRLEVPA